MAPWRSECLTNEFLPSAMKKDGHLVVLFCVSKSAKFALPLLHPQPWAQPLCTRIPIRYGGGSGPVFFFHWETAAVLSQRMEVGSFQLPRCELCARTKVCPFRNAAIQRWPCPPLQDWLALGLSVSAPPTALSNPIPRPGPHRAHWSSGSSPRSPWGLVPSESSPLDLGHQKRGLPSSILQHLRKPG